MSDERDPVGAPPAAAPPAFNVRRLDSRALQGLAHPLRVRLFEELTYTGPATATQLAERLGESSGATSYHLRQLARSGFVEEDAARGTQRERWWRRVPGGIQWGDADQEIDSAGRAATDLLNSEFAALAARRRAAALVNAERWPRRWHESQLAYKTHLVLTADEAVALGAELRRVVDDWKRRRGDRDLVPAGERGTELADVDVEIVVVPLLRDDQLDPS